jgi:hypothetical protein
MLFRNETPLHGPVSGTSVFTRQFERQGPKASRGRNLRQFDLRTRLFRYPCSYMIYSQSFDELPPEMKTCIWKRLETILTGKDTSEIYAGLTQQDRQNVWEILRETKPEFAAWLKDHPRDS